MSTLTESNSISLIDPADISVLKPAAELKTISANADYIHEVAAIARLCNLGANAGQKSAVWEHPMREDIRKMLTGDPYYYKVNPVQHTAQPNTLWTISWA